MKYSHIYEFARNNLTLGDWTIISSVMFGGGRYIYTQFQQMKKQHEECKIRQDEFYNKIMELREKDQALAERRYRKQQNKQLKFDNERKLEHQAVMYELKLIKQDGRK